MSALKAAEAAANAALRAAIARADTDAAGAIAALERLAAQFGDQPAILVGLAHAQRAAGLRTQAAATLERVLTIAPNDADALNNLANLRRTENRLDEALDLFRRAHAVRPNDAVVTNNFAGALRTRRRHDEALAVALAWRAARPDEPLAVLAIVEALIHKRRGPAAVAMARRLTAMRPDAVSYACLARALECDGQYREAVRTARAAVALDPNEGLGLCALVETLASLGELEEAEQHLITLRARFRDIDPRALASRVLFLKGASLEAWRDYEHRFEITHLRLPNVPKPRWRGEPVAGKRILLIGEQGMGDNVQFARCAWEIAARGGQAILHLAAELAPLFTHLAPGVRFATSVDPDAFDLWAPILSAPLALGDPLGGGAARYLRPPSDKARPAAMAGGGRKIGLVWAGAPGHAQDYLRSCGLAALTPLLARSDLRFFALQKGAAAAEIEGQWAHALITDLGPNLNDWGDTAAALAALDLLITVDTSIAHVAGAMGKPVWTLLQYAPDWRWRAHGADTPWYPSMRLYRQTTPLCWRAPVAQIARDLDALQRGGWPAAPV
jgi:tetratricopeptide (TPR) repeat protein